VTIERLIGVLEAEGVAAREARGHARTAAEAECYERQTRVIGYASTAAHLCLAHKLALCELERRLAALERPSRRPVGGLWGWLWNKLG